MTRDPRYLTVSELFKDAQPSTLQEDVRREIDEEREKNILDPSVIRRNQDWSFLGQQVVGAEHKHPYER